MKDVIGTLKTIRNLRERRKAGIVRKLAKSLEDAEATLRQIRAEKEEFTTYRASRIAEIYNRLLGQSVGLRDLDWFRFELDALKKQALALEERIAQAEKTCAETEKALQDSKGHHAEAMRQVSKFETIADERAKDRQAADILHQEAQEEDTVEALIAHGGTLC